VTALLPTAYGQASVLQDLMAAEIVSTAADEGSAAAQELVDEVNDALGVAYVHRHRCKRLKGAAGQATLAGEHDIAALIGRFAGEEAEAAQEHEAVASGLIRGTHSFGYLSAEEMKFLKRKKFEQGMTSAQAEQVYDSLLNRLFQVAANFGSDEEGFGAEGEEPEPEELDDGSIEAFSEVVDALGGDMPLVFGADWYGAYAAVYGASRERLEKRVEDLEDEGKTGLRVRVLHWRIGKLEKRIGKIGRKIKKLKKSKRKARGAREDSETVAKAEDSAVRSTVEPDLDELPEDPSAMESAMSDDDTMDDLEEELGDLDEFDLEGLEEADDDALGAEVEVFGLSDRRRKRMLRRVVRLEARLERLKGRRRGLFRKGRMRRILRRIKRLKGKLMAASGASLEQVDDAIDLGPAAGPSPVSPGGYSSPYTTPTVSAYTSTDDYVSSFFGSANVGASPERQPFVCYFRRRAEAKGSPNGAFGAEGEGLASFFERLGEFFNTVLVEPVQRFFALERREVRRERRQERRAKVKAWAAERRAKVQARRSAARAERKEARKDLGITHKRKALQHARQGRRKEAKAAAKAAWRAGTPGVKARSRTLRRGRRGVRQRTRTARWQATPGGGPRSAIASGPDGIWSDPNSGYAYRTAGDRLFIHKSPLTKRLDQEVDPGSRAGHAILSQLQSGQLQQVA
jgi:hypothetical protein